MDLLYTYLLGKMINGGFGGSGGEEQAKTVNITENGTTVITPDAGKTLSSVTAVVNVESGGEQIIKTETLFINPVSTTPIPVALSVIHAETQIN